MLQVNLENVHKLSFKSNEAYSSCVPISCFVERILRLFA